jgi:hypothetical protein
MRVVGCYCQPLGRHGAALMIIIIWEIKSQGSCAFSHFDFKIQVFNLIDLRPEFKLILNLKPLLEFSSKMVMKILLCPFNKKRKESQKIVARLAHPAQPPPNSWVVLLATLSVRGWLLVS